MSPGEGRGSSVPQGHGSSQKGTDSDRLGSAQEKTKYFIYLRNEDKMEEVVDRQSLERKKSGLACPTAHRTCSHSLALSSQLPRQGFGSSPKQCWTKWAFSSGSLVIPGQIKVTITWVFSLAREVRGPRVTKANPSVEGPASFLQAVWRGRHL